MRQSGESARCPAETNPRSSPSPRARWTKTGRTCCPSAPTISSANRSGKASCSRKFTPTPASNTFTPRILRRRRPRTRPTSRPNRWRACPKTSSARCAKPSSPPTWTNCSKRSRRSKPRTRASPRDCGGWPKRSSIRNCSICSAREPPLKSAQPEIIAGSGSGGVGSNGHAASILVVDDTPANLQVLAGMLKDRGYKVRPVPGGKLAILAAQRDPPDLILLDINMPDMNGYEVCERLKADNRLKSIPIIFISALTEPLDKVKAFSTGGVDYLTKPFHMEELHARVETHLKLRQLSTALEDANVRLERVNTRMSRDLEAAAKIQKTFLPGIAPDIPGVEFAWSYRPCDELAGDGLNIIPLGGGRVGLYILDVSGHGVASALLSVSLSRLLSPPSDASTILIRNQDSSGRFDVTPPADVAASLNHLFPFDVAIGQFATLMYGVLDVPAGDFRHVCAGHAGPLHLPVGAAPIILESPGFPIGV